MRVLFTTNIPSPYRVDFFNKLGEKCDLTVLYERREAADRNNEWLSLKALNFACNFMRGIGFGKDSAFCPGILKYLDAGMYDVFVIGGYCTPTGILSILYLKARNIPFVLDFDGGFIKEEGALKRYVKKFLIGSAAWWTSTGKKTNEYLCFYGADAAKIYNYNFSSLKKTDILQKIPSNQEKHALRKELKMQEKKIIVSVGRFDPIKGFDVLLKACASLDKDIGVYVIGGQITEEYESIRKKYRLHNVHFVEFKRKQELVKYYMAADLFVLPTRADIWGLVINEAMGCGLPVITTDCCIAGLELVSNGENGYIVPVENAKALAEQCSVVLKNEELRKKMSEQSLLRIQPYTIENMADRYYEIFKETIC